MNHTHRHDPIPIALIGAGRIGELHAANLAAHPGFQLLRVYDADSGTAQRVAARHGAAVAAAPEDIFTDSAIRAVLVASTTATHCDYITAAARAGQAVLCEKPLALELAVVEQCGAALAALDHPTAPLVQVGFNRRYDPGHAALRARVVAGEIGRLEILILTSRDPAPPPPAYLSTCGGLFRDMMIHDFDLARAILPQEPVRLFAATAALVDQGVDQGADADTAMAILQTADGVLCHINCSRRAAYGYDQRVEAFGADGMLISTNRTADSVEHYHRDHTAARAPLLHFFTERYAEAFRLQLDAFAAAVHGTAPPEPTFADGQRALMLALAAEESVRTGRWAECNP